MINQSEIYHSEMYHKAKIHYLILFIVIIQFLVQPKAYGEVLNNTLTIYSTVAPNTNYEDINNLPASALPGYAIFNAQKNIELKSGLNIVTLTDIPRYIDPTTVLIRAASKSSSASQPEQITFKSQEYRFDLKNNNDLLQRYMGREITLEQNAFSKTESYTGKLLTTDGSIVLENDEGEKIAINNYNAIRFPKLKENIYSNPSIIVEINSKKNAIYPIEMNFQTAGLSFWTEYNGILKETEKNKGVLDFAGWANIINKSGSSFKNVEIQLLAGEQNRAFSPPMAMVATAPLLKGRAMDETSSNFTEKSFFDYHLYTLGYKIDLEDNTIKQWELFPKVKQIPVLIEYRYMGNENFVFYGQPNLTPDPGFIANTTAETYLKFKNDTQSGLGIPLPMGRIRLYQEEKNSLLLIGETTLSHTPKEAEILLKVGKAFDITIQQKQTNFKVDENRHQIEESYEITVKNQKDQDIVLFVRENLFRSANWQITQNSESFEKKDAQTIEFELPVKKGNETKLTYTVKYTW